MKQILSALKKTFRHSLAFVSLMAWLGLGLFILPNQPVYAGLEIDSNPIQKSAQVNTQVPESTATLNRDMAYEEAVKAVKSPENLEKVYEKDLQAYEEAHPEKGIVKTAEKLVEKVVAGEDPVLK